MPKSELATDPNVDGLSDYVKSIAYDFGAMAGKKKLEADTEKSKTASIGSKVGIAKESDMSYTENAALLQYKSSESYKVNAKLREGIELDAFEQQFVKNLDSALEKLPKYEGTLYRNLVFDDVGGDQEGFDSFMEVHQPGNPVFYEAFTSTATEQDGYPLEGKYVVHMVIANSKNARDVSGYGNNFENEAIYPRNATFFVDKIDYDSNATPIIYLQEDFESGEKRKYEQLHTQKRSKYVRKMQESHSEDNYLQGVSRADSNGNFRSTQALQGVSRQINVESKGQNEQFKSRNNKAAEVKVLSEQERNRVKNIANRLGRTVVFEDTKSVDGKFSDGYLDKNGVIHIDYSCIDPVNFVLKHELTHFTERSEKYKDFFKKTVESKAFEKWINRQIPGNKGLAAKKGEYRQQIKDRYAKRGIELSNTKLDAEMLANFVGEVLFDENGSGLESIVSDMNVRERSSFVQLIKDFIIYIKRRLAGKDVPFEIIRLERLFNETLSSAGNKNTAEDGGGVMYSFAGEKAANADKSLLEIAKQRIENGENSETVRKETGWFKGYDGKWRFEIDDSMSELIENPKFETHGSNETGFYKTARLEDIFKHDNLFKAYPQLKDCTVIIQETEPGTQGISFTNQIVLSNSLFERITKEYNDYLKGGRKAEIAKIEQTPEYKEYSKFYDNPELANIDPEEWLKLEKEARDKFFSSELGKRYYQLQWGKVDIRKYEPGWSKEAKAVLLHEIQHNVQQIEEFAKGSSPDYWARTFIDNAFREKNRLKDEILEKADADTKYIISMYDEYIDRLSYKGDISETEFAKAYDRAAKEIFDENIEELFFDYAEANEEYYRLKKNIATKSSIAYRNTAGEIEARDVSNRLDYTSEQRKNTRPDIDRTDVVFADGGVSYDLDERLAEQINDWKEGFGKKYKSYNGHYFRLGTTPDVLLKHGAPNAEIIMYEDCLVKVTGGKHSISLDEISKLPSQLNDPILLFCGSVPNSFVALTELLDKHGNDVIAAVHINKYQGRTVVNKIASLYSKSDDFGNNQINNYIKKQINDGNLIDVSTKKAPNWFTTRGLQLPKVVQTILDANRTIPPKAQSVNTYDMQDGGKNSLVGEKDANSYSISSDATDLLDRYESGEISREEYLEENRRLWEKAGEEYSTIENGEFAEMRRSEASVPKKVEDTKKVKRFVRTVLETGTLTEEAVADTTIMLSLQKWTERL